MPDEIQGDQAPEEPAVGIDPETAALVARETVNKAKDEKTHDGIEFGTVLSISFDEGLVPMVNVRLAGDDPDVSQTVPSLTGVAPEVGDRVAVIWDNPAGCYIIGTPDLITEPTARLSLVCGFGPAALTSGTQTVPWCCEEFSHAIEVVADGSGDPPFVVTRRGTYLLTAMIRYTDGISPPVIEASGGDIEAYVEVVRADASSFIADRDVNYVTTGVLRLASQFQLVEGDTVTVYVQDLLTNAVDLAQESHVELTYITGSHTVNECSAGGET
ncbi:MAG TPA: hypothetical protein VMX12_08350 [Acidimicrobiia bacterium]|nr:hypothetical protein [Acidimicrobiia bacterium]